MEPLILWGGTDISPSIYEQEPLTFTQKPDLTRDLKEIQQIHLALSENTPIIGICRGAQLLCALNGGSLYQHSIGHNYSHGIETFDGKLIEAEADHHQIMKPSGDFKLYAWSNHSTEVWLNEKQTEFITKTPEVVWWSKTKCLAIQPHPEWEGKNSLFKTWINDLIFDLIGEKNVF